MWKDHLISIVGAGPGDPELLTLRALKRIEQADVILYDALHGEEILHLASEGATKVYAGKHYQDGQHQTERQDKIHQQLKQFAIEGKRVVRLKAGDPFIFGRGAEELEFCLNEGLNVEVVPGITAGLAAATTFHIPVTLRGVNSMALFYTGHKRDGGFEDIDTVASVLKAQAPVMLYMGLKNMEALASELDARQVSSDLPMQIVSRVGHPDQQIFSTKLSNLTIFLTENDIPMPAVIVMGSHAIPVCDNGKKGSRVDYVSEIQVD
ncbi:uroporphyrinogen-III C-methyltransferase [Mangrovibacterium diazotrophicum]|uniref:uroporphyrinogen-III C-methyltransferase n=1 Tax=Mangrovibacterium diazotrophicum TaxID=1261403 RepID=A0A419W505_9BACT|nr:uroporphyrinogen-III C-methyltransferase [Mangrovibacterium diazotrophicum]RKD90534.1 uroporphyrinogen-III C-methyltransferase [Mangrovibacterium diazotrophicum]